MKATVKQINLIKIIARGCGYRTRNEVDDIDFIRLTQQEARAWINRLKKEVGWSEERD